MKKNTIIGLLIVTTTALLLASFKHEKGELQQTAMIRVLEPFPGALASPRLVVSKGTGVIKEIKLKKISGSTFGQNADIIVSELNKLHEEGYKLASTHGGDYIRTYVLKKE